MVLIGLYRIFNFFRETEILSERKKENGFRKKKGLEFSGSTIRRENLRLQNERVEVILDVLGIFIKSLKNLKRAFKF